MVEIGEFCFRCGCAKSFWIHKKKVLGYHDFEPAVSLSGLRKKLDRANTNPPEELITSESRTAYQYGYANGITWALSLLEKKR